MPNARHPKQYPRGDKHPKLQLTSAWKTRVLQALESNTRAGKAPGSRTELAKMIGADKGGLHKMLNTDQPSYKYARQICDVLGIDEPMIANPAINSDEWDAAVARARSLPLEQQLRALRVLKAAIDDGS